MVYLPTRADGRLGLGILSRVAASPSKPLLGGSGCQVAASKADSIATLFSETSTTPA